MPKAPVSTIDAAFHTLTKSTVDSDTTPRASASLSLVPVSLAPGLKGYRHASLRFFDTVSTNPMVTEIVDEGLFSSLKKAGLSDGDARHLMYAIHNKCDRFVTLDTRDLLPKRWDVAPLCRGTKIVTPSELAAELSAS
jgi:hypothetical protein